jgi:hypothetical protein
MSWDKFGDARWSASEVLGEIVKILEVVLGFSV